MSTASRRRNRNTLARHDAFEVMMWMRAHWKEKIAHIKPSLAEAASMISRATGYSVSEGNMKSLLKDAKIEYSSGLGPGRGKALSHVDALVIVQELSDIKSRMGDPMEGPFLTLYSRLSGEVRLDANGTTRDGGAAAVPEAVLA